MKTTMFYSRRMSLPTFAKLCWVIACISFVYRYGEEGNFLLQSIWIGTTSLAACNYSISYSNE